MDILAKAALTAGGVQGLCWIVVASGKVKAHQLSGLPYAAGVAAASFYGFSTCYPSAYRSSKLVVLLTACWAARLAGYLQLRSFLMNGHDARYDKLTNNSVQYLKHRAIAALLCVILSTPNIAISQSPDADSQIFGTAKSLYHRTTKAIFWIGIAVSSIGVLVETVADFQKCRFKVQNPQQPYLEGLFRFCHHPNFLGEILFFVGLSLAGIPFSLRCGWLHTVLTCLAPLLITRVITKRTGIPILRAAQDKKYGQNASYVKWRDSLHPLIPKFR